MPVRSCVGCRERADQADLIRFAAVDGKLREGRRLPGRGAWLHPRRECFELAVGRKAFSRSLRTPIDSKDAWQRSA